MVNKKCQQVWTQYRMDLMPEWARALFAELAGEIERLERERDPSG